MNTTLNPKYKILVVDDDLDLNTGFALLLEFDGHEVQTAYTGEAAVEMLKKEHFDLAIIEYWLPRMTGDQLAAQVKHHWPDVHIIMVTANFGEIHPDNHPIAGVDCLLDKPFSMEQLRAAINWTFDRGFKQPRQEVDAPWMIGGRQTATGSSQSTPKNFKSL